MAWATAERHRRWRSLLALGLLLGVLAAMPLTLAAGARRTATSLDRLLEATAWHDVWIQVDGGDVDDVLAVPAVEEGAEAAIYPAFADLESSFDLGVIAPRDETLFHSISRPLVLEGRLPAADEGNEVAVNENTARTFGVGTGDVLELGTLSPEQLETIEEEFSGELEGPTLRLEVTGVVRAPDDLRGDEANVSMIGSVAFDTTHAGEVGAYSGLAVADLRPNATAAQFEEEARAVLPPTGELDVIATEYDLQSPRDAVRALAMGLALVAAGAAVAALIAGGQGMSRQLRTSGAAGPALSALGVTRRERFVGLLLVHLPVLPITVVVAAALGFLLSPTMPVNLARDAEPDLGFDLDALAFSVGVGLLVLVVAGGLLGFAWRAARVTTDSGDVRITRPAISTRIAGAVGFGPSAVAGVRLATSSTAGRSGTPARPAIVAAAVAVLAVAATLTFGSSLDQLLTTPARYGAPWDLQPDLQRRVEEVVALPEVADAGSVYISQVRVEDTTLRGFSMRSLKGGPTFSVIAGRAPAASHEIGLGEDLLATWGVAIGDEVEVDDGEGSRSMTVVGELLAPDFEDGVFTGGVFLTPPTHRAVNTSGGFDQVVLRWADGVDPADAEARVLEIDPLAISQYSHARPPGEIRNLGRLEDLPALLALCFVVSGLAACAHALLISATRRREEVAILRSIGFVRRQIVSTFTWQAATIAGLAIIVGLPLGLAVGRWAWTLVARGIGVADDPLVPIGAVLVVAPAALLLAVALAVLPAWRIRHLDAARVLRAE